MAKLYTKKTAYGITTPFIKIDNPTIRAQYDPTVNDKWEVGQLWLNELLNTVWMLTSNFLGVPVWTELDNSGSPVITWTVEALPAINLTNDHGYILTNAGPAIVLTLPAISQIGSIIEITTDNITLSAYLIRQNAGQQIKINNILSTPGLAGFARTTAVGQTVKLVTLIANTIFSIVRTTAVININ